MRTLIDHFMRNKRSVHGEIAVVLFENCNLRCSFCPQNHTTTKGMENIIRHYPLIKTAIDEFDDDGKQLITVNIQGGEIFQDIIPDYLFDEYYELVNKVNEYSKEVDATVQFCFGTNLIHTKTDRVITFLNKVKENIGSTNLMVSYDPASRFSKNDLIIFEANLELYADHIDSINLNFTKPNIKKILNGDSLFDSLYNRFECTFDYYQLEPNKKTNAPSDQDLQDIFLYLVKHYPKVIPIKGYFENQINDSIYQHTKNAMVDTVSGFCDINLQGTIFQDSDVSFQEMEIKFLEDMGCMSCEYFDKCGLGCIPQHYFYPEYKTLDECWQKNVHKEIEKLGN